MNIYIGNLPYAATETDLEELFQEYGPIATATIIYDRDDGRSKGFGFVEMENQEDGERAIAALNGQEMMGRPLRVNPARPRGQRPQPDPKQENSPREYRSPAENTQDSSPDGDLFHNPYTFVPTPPRQTAINQGGFAGDFDPLKNDLDQASLKPNLWTGHIPIKLTTVTPMVLLKDDGKERDPRKHQTYDVLDYIPESSLRGMLRSAYEVVTNSRYACFRNDDQLAYRMDTRDALKLVPAIIEDGGNPGELKARLYPGTSTITSRGPGGPMYAAMLDKDAKYVSGGEPKTRDTVWAEIDRRQHRRGYRYWKVVKVWQTKPTATGNIVEGRVLITNENMGNKHDERIFFNREKRTFDITNNLKKAWRVRIQSYRDAHAESDIFKRKGAVGKPWKKIRKGYNEQDEMGWSPHLYEDGKHKDRWGRDTHDALELQAGDMVYARCSFKKGKVDSITDLFPVMISRELYANSPKDILGTLLQPATKMKQLSPADRLFGWVPQQTQDSAGQSKNGCKSRIRVVSENGKFPTIVADFKNDPMPLTILGQPKPAQGRFYVAKDVQGNPQENGDPKSGAGYDAGKGLRGRKHYWHHTGLEAENDPNYWDPSAKSENKEYIRTNRITDPQNRSIKGWIEPGNEFEVSLYVQNLQREEVGALLWLLTLPKDHYFKLGYGKPLGFGSVKMEIDEKRLKDDCIPLGTGENWKAYYAKLEACSPATLDACEQSRCIQEFQDRMKNAYQEQNFDNLSFIKGFKQVLKGPDSDDPIHYPRRNRIPDPAGKNYDWFVDNENGRKRSEDGRRMALPAVTDKAGLPYNPSKPKPKKGWQ